LLEQIPGGHRATGISARIVRWGDLPHGVHKNVWGFVGLTLESPLLSPHIGAAAGKCGRRRERQGSRRKPLGDSQISGFFSPWSDGCDGRGAVMRPARRFAFWGSGERVWEL